MPKYESFEELPVWQESTRLYNAVLDIIEVPNCPLPPGFRNQLDRAALAVGCHIVEGYFASTAPDRLQCLGMARGAASDVRSMMAVIVDRPKAKPLAEALKGIRSYAESCARQISGWQDAVEGGRGPGGAPRAEQETLRSDRSAGGNQAAASQNPQRPAPKPSGAGGVGARAASGSR